MWKVFSDSEALLCRPSKKEMSHMYIKLLLERLFKDLFFRKPNVHYYNLQVCAYYLYMKHKFIVLKAKLLCFLQKWIH